MRNQRANKSLRERGIPPTHEWGKPRVRLQILGLKQGPRFKEILEAASTLQLEGTLTTREAAMEWARENAV